MTLVASCGRVEIVAPDGGGGGDPDPPAPDPDPDPAPPGGGGSPGVSPSDFAIECFNLPGEVAVGETGSLLYQVLSETDTDATITVAVNADGVTVGTDTRDVPAGGVIEGEFEVTFVAPPATAVGVEVIDAQPQ